MTPREVEVRVDAMDGATYRITEAVGVADRFDARIALARKWLLAAFAFLVCQLAFGFAGYLGIQWIFCGLVIGSSMIASFIRAYATAVLRGRR